MSEGIISSSTITDSRLVGSTVGMVGYGCSMSTILISAYSPLLATPEISSPVTHGMTHALLFFAMACTYFVFFHFIKNCDRYMCSKKLQVIFLLLQLALPVVALVNNVAHFNVPIPLTATAWICFGVASGYFTCAWTAAQNGIAARRIRSVNIISFCIAACISLFVFCMPTMVELVSLIALCVISCGILMRAPHRGGEVIDTDSSDWFEKSKFNKDGSYVMFVNGIMLGVFTGLLVARVSRDVLPIFSIGIAFVIVSIMFCVLAKTAPSYLSLDKAQLIFLPVVVAGVIVIGFFDAPLNTIGAYVLFIILYLFDYTNTSVLSLRGRILSVSPCYCFSRGRIFIIGGQAIGWVLGSILASVGRGGLPLVSIILIVLSCMYIAAITIHARPDNQNSSLEIEQECNDDTTPVEVTEPIKHTTPYKNKCALTAKKHDLTIREGEILVYLAKGRNAKYIAEKLFVAERTVKTHTYHIYQKLGIHSQQELIDIVESVEKDGNENKL